jgi:hypothetical protein
MPPGRHLHADRNEPEWRTMVRIIVLLILLVAVFIGYPLLNEDTASSCSALAFRAIDKAGPPGDTSSHTVNSLLARLVGGAGTMEYARRRSPYLPAFLTCSALYWQTVIDPSSVAKVWADLGGDELLRGGDTSSVGNVQQPPATPPSAQDYPPPSRSAPSVPLYWSQGHADMDRSFNQPQRDMGRLFDKPQGGCSNQLDQDGFRC